VDELKDKVGRSPTQVKEMLVLMPPCEITKLSLVERWQTPDVKRSALERKLITV